MSTIKKLFKNIFVVLALVLTFNFLAPTEVQADVWDDLGGLFQVNSGDQGLSFTQYEGGLTELSSEGLDESLTESSNLREFVITIVKFALGFLGLIAVIIFIYSGYLYVLDAGNDGNTEKAKKGMLNATIGIIIILGSYAAVNTILDAGGGGDGDQRNVIGANTGLSFNASAVQVESLARDIYEEFILYSEAIEEVNGILSDLEKDSLNYRRNFVDRDSMSTFLYTTRNKLANLRARFPKFSEPYTEINRVIRGLDQASDSVRNANFYVPSRLDGFGGLKVCYVSGDRFIPVGPQAGELEESEDSQVTVAGVVCGGETYNDSYPLDIFYYWTRIAADLSTPEGEFYLGDMLEAMKRSYIVNLEEHFTELVEVRQSLTGIASVEVGDIGQVYSEMRGHFGFDAQGEIDRIALRDSFVAQLEALTLENFTSEGYDALGRKLYQAVQKQLEFSQKLAALKGVEARLRANVVSGNAPLVVTFDVLESSDPAGGTILDQNVDWSRIDGSVTLDGKRLNLGDAVTCNNQAVQAEEDQEVFGPTFRQCVFKYPGTYTATVEIQSNEPGTYISGVSSLTIRVNPPKTNINLDLAIGDVTIPVMAYLENGLLNVDRNYVPITLAEAKRGIRFDASKTKNAVNFNWDFGPGSRQNVENDAIGVQELELNQAGQYRVTLEVTNRLNEVDKKIFTLDVRDIAARISVSPSRNAFINSPISFDASRSTSDSGGIRAYEWQITKQNAAEPVVLGNKSASARFTHEFTEPGRYKVDLAVFNEIGRSDAEPVFFDVKSREPVASFSHKVEKDNKPNVYLFDASDSYDPDGPSENLEYLWKITPADGWELENGAIGEVTEQMPRIKFTKTGTYKVNLRVTDTTTLNSGLEEFSDIEREINVDKILDIDFSEAQKSTAQLQENGQAQMAFFLASENGVAYEIDFGDGESDSGDIREFATINHTYAEAGRYPVRVTVYDSSDEDNQVTRRILIGDGGKPVAKATVLLNGEVYEYQGQPIRVGKKDALTFDASESKNLDGTGRNLKYSWNFGDTDTSTRRIAPHTYGELSPANPGYYTVKLTVTDTTDPTLTDTDEIRVDVVNKPPIFSSVQGVIASQRSSLITPVEVQISAYGAVDPDGSVVQYKWWYFDVDDPEEELGIVITKTPSANVTIGTRGTQGERRTYGFGLEIMDNDGLTFSNAQAIEDGNYATMEVVNGANDLPQASFEASATTLFTGDKVVLTSSSKDSDGRIVRYIWDIDGDGFFNDIPTDKSTIEHTYSTKNLTGYDVRLKVIDDKGGESVSRPLKIYVDSVSQPPEAAFRYEVIPGSGGYNVRFTNNSTADSESSARIVKQQWDFDTASGERDSDSDGDGFKNNDKDSSEANPSYTYAEVGQYQVKLTVTDNQGNTDSVTNTVAIPLAEKPVAAFNYRISGDKLVLENNSTADSKVGASLVSYKWDFDTRSSYPLGDSDGDGNKENDSDSTLRNPIHDYANAGTYFIKLTVTDSQGNQDEVVNEVNYLPTASPAAGPQAPTSLVRAILQTDPAISNDGRLYLPGSQGRVKLNFALSTGPIAKFVIDKNTALDSDGNGTPDDDKDFQSLLPGSWTTTFLKSAEPIVVRLTAFDQNGGSDSTNLEIRFR